MSWFKQAIMLKTQNKLSRGVAGAWWDKGLLQHSVVPRGQGLQQASPSRPSLYFLPPAVALSPSQEEKEAENLGSQRGVAVWWYFSGQTSKLRDSLGVGCWWEEESHFPSCATNKLLFRPPSHPHLRWKFAKSWEIEFYCEDSRWAKTYGPDVDNSFQM